MEKNETPVPETVQSEGAARRFKDLTSEEKLYVDSVWVLSVMFCIVCLWAIFMVIWNTTALQEQITADELTTIMELAAIIALLLLLKKTSITVQDLGLSPDRFKKAALRTLYRVPIMFGVFCGAKLIFMAVKPEFFKGAPFWDWSQADSRLYKYLFTSLLQELLSRGGVQEALTRVLPGKHADLIAIFMTSVFFMALHVQRGLFFMLGAGVLSFVLGLIYRKDRSVFSVWLIHYFFGKFGDFFRFI